MAYLKGFDELLNDILTDYRNQFPEADTSQGSLIFIKSACLASALWGLYHYQEYISRQIFPDTADTDNLEHHGWVRGLSKTFGETDAAYLARLLDYIRRPPAGGNQYDYRKWAEEIDNVAAAYCFPLAQGLGTVDVVILANEVTTGSEVPTSHDTLDGTTTSIAAYKLIDSAASFQTVGVGKGDPVTNTATGELAAVVSVDSQSQVTLDRDIFTGTPGATYNVKSLTVVTKEYIDDVRPVTASVVRVFAPTILMQAATMTVTGTNAKKSQIAADIAAYMATLIPGQTLYRSQLISIAIENGADNVTISVPAADVVPTAYQMIRAGAINVS